MVLPRPQLAAPAPWQFPKNREYVLSNGLKVWLFDLPGQKILDLRLILPAPLSAEPKDKEGLASLVAHLADEGTHTHPGAQIAELLETHGGVYYTTVGYSSTTVGLATPGSRLAKTLPYFVEMVTEPEFNQTDIDVHLALRKAELEQLKVNPNGLANLLFSKVILGWDSRVARLTSGSTRTLSNIAKPDVDNFHQSNWTPNSATLIISGELPDQIDSIIENNFSAWTGPASSPPAQIVRAEVKPKVWLLDRPDAVQADVRIGCFGIDRLNLHWPGLRIATAVIGGMFGSRLNRVLREEKGFTYGAHLVARPFSKGGVIEFISSFRTDIAAQAIQLSHEILALATPISGAEIAEAKQFIVGSARLGYDGAEAIGDQAGALASCGLDPQFLTSYFTKVRAAGEAEINTAYRSCVGELSTVVVGKANPLATQLEANGFDVQLVELDQLAI